MKNTLATLALAASLLLTPIAAQAAQAVDTVIIIICDASSCVVIIVQ